MSHPFHEHRQHHVERNRVHHIAGTHEETRTHHIAHRKDGGRAEHSDEAEDKAMIKREVKSSALKHADGHKPHHRQDKVKRASGGRAKHKGHGKTNVNVIVAPQGGHPMMAGGPPMPPPAAAPPAMPPRPPMPPPGGAPGMPPPGLGAAPGMMGPRRHGGRAYAKGGAVKSGNTWEEGRREGTQPWNLAGKNDDKDSGRGKPVTYATGGPIYAPAKGHMGPKLPGGSGGAEARLFKKARVRRHAPSA